MLLRCLQKYAFPHIQHGKRDAPEVKCLVGELISILVCLNEMFRLGELNLLLTFVSPSFFLSTWTLCLWPSLSLSYIVIQSSSAFPRGPGPIFHHFARGPRRVYHPSKSSRCAFSPAAQAESSFEIPKRFFHPSKSGRRQIRIRVSDPVYHPSRSSHHRIRVGGPGLVYHSSKSRRHRICLSIIHRLRPQLGGPARLDYPGPSKIRNPA